MLATERLCAACSWSCTVPTHSPVASCSRGRISLSLRLRLRTATTTSAPPGRDSVGGDLPKPQMVGFLLAKSQFMSVSASQPLAVSGVTTTTVWPDRRALAACSTGCTRADLSQLATR